MNKKKLIRYVKRGKSYYEYCKLLKKIAYKLYGFSFYFCSASERERLIEHIDYIITIRL